MERALALLGPMLTAAPKDAELYYLRGMAYSNSGRLREALTDFDAALMLSPGAPPVLFNRALTFYRMERLEEALADFELLVKVDPNSVEALANAGIIHLRRESYSQAVNHLQRALALAPRQPQLMRSLANAFRGEGKVDQALRLHLDVEAAIPDDAAALTDHALTLLTSNQVEVAQSYYLKTLRLHPGDQTALAGLYMTANELGQTELIDTLMDYHRLLACSICGPEEMLDLNSLRASILSHEHLTWEPIGRSTRRGQQSAMLDISSRAPFSHFGQILRSFIARRFEDLEVAFSSQAHPWLVVRPSHWRLQVWATVLHEGGRQSPHIHPAGWMSGVFYVDVGDAVGEDSGALVFGHPPHNLPLSADAREWTHRPQNGQFITFPSYFFHHTLPYAGKRPRISLAFDVIPTTSPHFQ